MKLRQIPDDFIVEEIPLHTWKDKGAYAVYKVSKVGMTTFAAEKVLSKHCDVPFNKIGFAGLKDTHARTVQYFSVETNEPQKGVFKERNVQSELVGFLDAQLRTGDLKGNKFIITVRDLKEKDIETLEKNAEAVSKGIPNYFDSQRFGSLKGVTGFIAKDILLGNSEEAVKKVVTARNRHQKSTVRAVKHFIENNWGKWQECAKELENHKLERTADANIMRHLAANPTDFKGAFRKTFKGIRELFFSAYQSYLWNECVKILVRKNSKEVFSVEYEAGKLVFPRSWNPDAKLGTFPLLAPDMQITAELKPIIFEVLKKEGIQITDLFTDEHIYVARPREVILTPQNLEIEAAQDERAAGKSKAILTFQLPKGAYATIITKALFEQ